MFHPKDKDPEYTPLPLPDPNSEEYACATAKKKPRRLRWFLATVFVLLFLAALVGAAIGNHYWKKTEHLDLGKVAFTQIGSEARDRDGESMGRLFTLDRLPIQISDLPGHFIDALVATEDSRFFEHPGFDPAGIARAAVSNARAGDIREGASTITQQLARHCFQLGGRTFDRKMSEIAVAIRIEKAYSKHEIIEHYLNHIYFGSGFWGVGAAARGYFGKTVAELDIAESALLCAIIKSPSAYSPFLNPDIAVRVRNRSLARMQDLGLLDPVITAGETAKALTLTDRTAEAYKRPRFLLSRIQKEARGITKEHHLPVDGLLIETSVDSQLQQAARAHLEIGLSRVEADPDYQHPTRHDFHHRDDESEADGDKPARRRSATEIPPYLQGSAIVIHNGTGEILAAIGGRNFTDSEFDRAFGARRPPGTAFLPLVYAAAFEQKGIDIATELTDAPMDNRQVMIGGTEGVLGEWGRESFVSRYEGQISAGLALLDSRGAATVELGTRIGLEAIHNTARQAGIQSPLREYPSTFLGQSELTLAELAHAYTVFPNLGRVASDIHLVTRIYGPNGDLLYEAPQQPVVEPVTSELTAAHISAILRAGLYIGSNRAAYQELGLNDPSVAGKGGTTHGFTDGWFVGYNDVVTCAVWVGLDSPKEIHPRAFSRNVALPIWVDLMNALPEAPLRQPAGCIQHKICLRTGLTASEGCVENFADGKPHSTALALPFPAGVQAPPLCEHHGVGQRFLHGLLAHSSQPDAGKADDEKNSADPNTQLPKVIRSRTPLVIGPDPYAGQ
jgi:penicillin-binding protein 1A